MRRELVRSSRFLSLVLRHDPGRIGLHLDDQGWASITELIVAARSSGIELTDETLQEIVRTNEKQRFAISPDGSRIRARQGHSIAVDLGLSPVPPPDLLYHGTATRSLDSILARGLLPRRRQHVHLSPDVATATEVGRRHGEPVVLAVDARRMHEDGHVFYCSENGVWLTAAVPREFLSVVSS